MADDTNKIEGTPGPLDVEFTPDPTTQSRFIGANAENETSKPLAVKAEAGKLGSQAGDKLRAFADDGKTRATGALDDVAKMINDAAGTLDETVGEQFGGYARSASGAIANFSESLRGKDVDDLVEDAKSFVRKSPAVAIAGAAAIGFVLARVLRSGVDANRDA